MNLPHASHHRRRHHQTLGLMALILAAATVFLLLIPISTSVFHLGRKGLPAPQPAAVTGAGRGFGDERCPALCLIQQQMAS